MLKWDFGLDTRSERRRKTVDENSYITLSTMGQNIQFDQTHLEYSAKLNFADTLS